MMNGSSDKKKKGAVGCPYCTREIPFNAKECPWCGTGYGLQTMELLRSYVEKGGPPPTRNRRMEDRVPKKFRVAYSTPRALKESYLSNISLGGVYIRTNSPLDPGVRLALKIFLPDGDKELEVECEVAWAQTEDKITSNQKHPRGMGIKFLNLSSEGKKRIEALLRQAGSEA